MDSFNNDGIAISLTAPVVTLDLRLIALHWNPMSEAARVEKLTSRIEALEAVVGGGDVSMLDVNSKV